MSVGVLPSLPNLQQSVAAAAGVPVAQQPAAPPTTSAGVGTSAPQPGVAPAAPGSGSPSSQPSAYERAVQKGLLPPGLQFANDDELVERLAVVAQRAVAAAESAAVRPNQPASQQAPPATPAQSNDGFTTEQLSNTAQMFQQQGLLTFSNGTWIATNPLANGVAEQLNRRVAQAQAAQAELADPEGFVRKYGMNAFKQFVEPLQQQQQQLQRQLAAMQQLIASQAPQPYDEFLEQHAGILFTRDDTGREVATPVGQQYGRAWDELAASGVRDVAALHKYAAAMIAHHLRPVAPAAAPASPPQPWSANIPPATDPAFSRPGSMVQVAQAPGAGSIPRNNQGLPDLTALVNNPNRAV